MVRLIVDGRRTQGTRTGVGHYAKSILDSWPLPAELEILLSTKHELNDSLGSNSVAFRPGIGWHIRAWLYVIRARGVYFSPESLIVPILLGRRALLTVHDLTPLDNPAVHKKWNVFVHRIAMRLAMARVGQVIVPTAAVKADVARHFPKAVRHTSVVYEGVREPDFTQVQTDGFVAPQKPYALYIGTIEPRKNVLQLCRAFLESAPKEWRLLLAGKLGWLSEQDRAAFLELCEHPRISHLGFVPDSWIHKLLTDAAVFCYVSEAEGFGLPVAEAMAAGVPVIHSDDAALLEVGGGAGFVVRRRHLAHDLREKFEAMAEMTDFERSDIIERGFSASRRFDWDSAAASTRALLLDLVHVKK